MIKKLVSIVALAAMAAAGTSEAAVYSIDTVHSSVGFKIRHRVGQTAGFFKEFSGTIDYNPKKPAKASVEVAIKTASIDTANEKRDGHLKTEDFFHVEKYPEMTFKSKKVKKSGKDKLAVTGDLTLHGVTKEVTLDVMVLAVEESDKKALAGFSAKTAVKRSDFGMNWNKDWKENLAMLGDEVFIEIEIEAVEK